METMHEVELSLPFLLLFLFLLLLCIVLLCQGVSPLRVLRSSWKAPNRAHIGFSGSDGEREALLAVGRVRYTGKVPLYTDTIAQLAACETTRETEAFIKVIDMHRLLNSKVKAQHFAEFCSRLELPVLSVSTLATIILSLQKYAAEHDVVTCIRMCFCSKQSMECLQLKNKVDTKFPMFDLIYHRIRSNDEREEILKHFETQAAVLRATPEFFAPLKLLCDIDDTMLAALFDTRYPELTVYPVLMGRFANMWGTQRIASGKLRNFVRFKRVFAEHRFVFVGDNGQGDIDLGKELLKNPHLYSVSAVLIHDVIRNHITGEPLSQHSYRGKECNQHGIHSFRTYIGASFHLYTLGILPLSGVIRVVEKTALAYAAIVFDTCKQKRNLAQEILADVSSVVNELPDHQAMALVSSLHDDLVVGDDDEQDVSTSQKAELTREQQLQQRLKAVRKNAAKSPQMVQNNVQEIV
ncbi:hypothetical protein BBO99_00004514 [Phytophthora kernoviae]|uniref:Phosphatidate phosphatase APP1 catalytic domain-containing protein n=2 Tax=Phytophthora kernoviae TaxID=325452 RepID=A0A3R7KUQ3_9STRA|nr:hypothetical protein G195_004946 [Phytophthora kernoviae 00238/432]KAG2521814.1 hypothetical protein JM16_004296 [Phytophthora kernoviae]KAG2523288.1 hypothetical protein JM18_003844 [Phytophthora kernoviae]RLN15153.1 hypothetical protein BBI17_004706 [Phytophthora kernoviae]RLN80388.1 hypothetical protein BBO99_00004514 [Phytophthora kernoviae]